MTTPTLTDFILHEREVHADDGRLSPEVWDQLLADLDREATNHE